VARAAVTAAVAAAAVLGGGCATVRHARHVQRGDDIAFGERTPRAAELGVTSHTVLTLAAAVQTSLKCQPAIAQAAQNLAAATAQAHEAMSAYLPSVNGSASYGRSTSNAEGAPTRNHSQKSYGASLTADLLVYDFGKTPAAVRQACEQAVAAEETLAAARNDAVFNVRSAFFNLCKAEELQGVSEQAVRQFREHLDQVKAFEEVGKRIRYDVTKAEVDLGNAQLNLITAHSDVSNARAGLNRSLGFAEDPGYRVQAGPAAEFAGSLTNLMDKARENHPELRALRARERLASAAVDQAIAALYPDLGLHGQYGGSGSRFPLIWNWSAAAQSVWNVFTGWQETWKVEEAVAQLRAARTRVADREQQLYQELSQALNQLESARERVGLTGLIVRQAQESLDLINERYRVGQASAVDVTDAQVALTSAQADRVKARFDYETAVAQIEHSVGEP